MSVSESCTWAANSTTTNSRAARYNCLCMQWLGLYPTRPAPLSHSHWLLSLPPSTAGEHLVAETQGLKPLDSPNNNPKTWQFLMEQTPWGVIPRCGACSGVVSLEGTPGKARWKSQASVRYLRCILVPATGVLCWRCSGGGLAYALSRDAGKSNRQAIRVITWRLSGRRWSHGTWLLMIKGMVWVQVWHWLFGVCRVLGDHVELFGLWGRMLRLSWFLLVFGGKYCYVLLSALWFRNLTDQKRIRRG